MATGLLALIDDVTALLDDVSAMSKIAAQKTAGIAGDDLAVNAESLTGLAPARELPIVGKVALGSALNKLVLIPLALALPSSAITPVLMVGGLYLSYEGVHKVLHASHKSGGHHEAGHADPAEPAVTPEELETTRVRQAILTDIVLSAEIVAVALGAVADAEFTTKAITLTIVAYGMTAFIYGTVAGIVKLDDLGLWLQETGEPGSFRHQAGRAVLVGTPWLMRFISIGGTIAMFLVGGGILDHGLHISHQLHLHGWAETGMSFVVGIVAGLIAVGVVEAIKALREAISGSPA